jgi:lysylphosphatidylglycerol synthetase-like protein (DUF2156 family)
MEAGQTALWALAGGALLVALLAAIADRRRQRRRDLDRVGWMPWPLLQILAAFAAVIAVILALRTG